MTDLDVRIRALAPDAPLLAVDPAAMREAARAARRRRTLRGAAVSAAGAFLVVVRVAVPGFVGAAGGDRLDIIADAPDTEVRPERPPVAQATSTVFPVLRHVVQMSGPAFGVSDVVFDPSSAVVGKDIVIPSTSSVESVAVAFDPVVAEDGCVDSAVLTMPAPATTGVPEVRAYPSAALSLAEGRLPPPENGLPTTLIDNRPFADAQPGPGRASTFDVTDIVRTLSTGTQFPSRRRSLPVGSPIVLLLRPPAYDDGTWAATYPVATRPPELAVTLAPGCELAEPPA